MFRCKVCEEKNLRITDLHKQIEFLKNQLQPTHQLPMISMEANDVLNGGSDKEEELPPEQIQQLLKEQAERNALLSGTYE